MRINQFVSQATGISRRAADVAIQEGRIVIDGHVAAIGEPVPERAVVQLDGTNVVPKSTHTLVMLNKPVGYISSRTRQTTAPTVYELLPEKYRGLRITGRLDRESSGLILLSDDGDFIQTHTHPSFEKEKIYELTLESQLSKSQRESLAAGIELSDGTSLVNVIAHDGKRVTVSLHQGRNRQLRRTFGALGITIKQLQRTAMGSYKLGDLAEGAWKVVKPL
jgi:23S rRNA pseudouridine2605 synthase